MQNIFLRCRDGCSSLPVWIPVSRLLAVWMPFCLYDRFFIFLFYYRAPWIKIDLWSPFQTIDEEETSGVHSSLLGRGDTRNFDFFVLTKGDLYDMQTQPYPTTSWVLDRSNLRANSCADDIFIQEKQQCLSESMKNRPSLSMTKNVKLSPRVLF